MRLDLDAEFEAAEVLARAGVMAPPVDPRRLARLWTGLRVTVANLDGAGYMVDLGPRGGEILVRAGDSPARRSFTCAHELGHWVLRAQDAGDVVRLPRAVVERWCDRFAVALLMPRAWVTSELVAGSLRIEAIAALADRFGVSLQTMLLRVSESGTHGLSIGDFACYGPQDQVEDFPRRRRAGSNGSTSHRSATNSHDARECSARASAGPGCRPP